MDGNRIPSLIGLGVGLGALAGAAGAGVGFGVLGATHTIGTGIVSGTLGGMLGCSIGGIAGLAGANCYQESREARRRHIANLPIRQMPIATSVPTPAQPRGRSMSVVTPAQRTRPPFPPDAAPHVAVARMYNQRAMPSTRGFQPILVRSSTSRRGARV